MVSNYIISSLAIDYTTPSAFDHLCEASGVGGFDTTLRSSPISEAQLITVGESPMIALYKITKVTESHVTAYTAIVYTHVSSSTFNTYSRQVYMAVHGCHVHLSARY